MSFSASLAPHSSSSQFPWTTRLESLFFSSFFTDEAIIRPIGKQILHYFISIVNNNN